MPQISDVALRVLGTYTAAFSVAFRFRRLRRADPPPLGLASPLLRPLILGGEGWDRHGLLYVTLDHGDQMDDSAPLVEITTRYRDLTDLAPEQALGELAHNDAAIRRGDWRDWRAWYRAMRDDTEADPPGPMTFSDADILIEGERCAVTVLTHGDYQAASFTRNGIAGTVASRHYAIDQLSLARVPAIDPYLDEYMAFLRQMPQRLRTRPGTT